MPERNENLLAATDSPDLSRLTDDQLIAYVGGCFDQADPVPAGAIPGSLAEAERLLCARYAPVADDELLLQWPPFPPRPVGPCETSRGLNALADAAYHPEAAS
jgi:hypothetical protein